MLHNGFKKIDSNMFGVKLFYIYIYIYKGNFQRAPSMYIAPPLNFGCSHMEKRVFSKATNNHRTITMWVFGLCLFLRFQFNVLLFFSFFFFFGSWTVTSHVFTVHTLKNIKNGSHDTIHVFKNYFVTILSVFSFSNNKLNPNGPYVSVWIVLILAFSIPCFAFFFGRVNSNLTWVHCSHIVYALFITVYALKNIKNRSRYYSRI